MKKKILSVSIILGVVFGIVVLSITYGGQKDFIRQIDDKQSSITYQPKIFEVKIYGAVEKPDTYTFNKNTDTRSALVKARLLPQADISQLDLDYVLFKNSSIYVPSKEPYIHYKSITSIDQIMEHKISKKNAEALLRLFKNKEKVTWQDIEKINGFGKTTLNKLKKILIL
ncbi:MAG0490 family ComEA-like DNA-binding protein [Mycoplasmopsis opalescens]|uniref:MAG0490 family ComEA-like DNA-binding protein n=1 Tax=Mycoplasmopsis opalescens TaxID=114886 RepID=UPI0004A6B3AC|nr:hypothetical protein [Mycoplasmopsis opalescens]